MPDLDALLSLFWFLYLAWFVFCGAVRERS